MPDFDFTSPEGKKYTVSGPAGSTKEQAFQILQQQIKSGSAKEQKTEEYKPEPSFMGMKNPTEEAKIRGVAPPSLAGTMLAAPEALMAMGSGMIAKPVSDIAGLTGAAMNYFKGEHNNYPAEFKNKIQNDLTYKPRHIEGEAASQYNPISLIGQGIGAVSHGVGNQIRGDNSSTLRSVAGNFAEEAIPQAIGLVGPKATSAAEIKVPQVMRSNAENLMQRALKPTINELKSGKAATAIDTMLSENIPLSKSGVAKIRNQINELNNQIKETVKNSDANVRVSSILPYVQEKLETFKKQVNPDADVKAIQQAWRDFKDHPLLQDKAGQIPVPLAQELKQGTYKQLNKKYGEMSTASNEAQKAIALGLKEGIAKNAPEVVEFNKQESRLLRTLPILERRVLMDANKNPMGLSLLTTDPVKWGLFMADKSAAFKGLVARILNDSQSNAKSAIKGVSAPTIAGSMNRPPKDIDQKEQP